MMARNIAVAQNGMFAAQAAPIRSMAKRGRPKKSDSEATVTEDEADAAVERESVPEPVKAAPKAAAQAVNVDKALFAPWSAGDIPKINSVEGNICPVSEQTIEGRYASVLFTSASMNEQLFAVYEDMSYICDLHENSEDFRMFTDNQGVGQAEIKKFNAALLETAPFSP
jgi:hypothetical protein